MTDQYDAITALNCKVLEQKLTTDAAIVASLRELRRGDPDAQRVSQLLGSASLLLEEAARYCVAVTSNVSAGNRIR